MNVFFLILQRTMPTRNQGNKKYFITIIHGNKRENHRVLINERIFNLNNKKKWKLYSKLILQYINYLCEIDKEDINLFLKDIITEVNRDSKMFKRKMGYILGDWSRF